MNREMIEQWRQVMRRDVKEAFEKGYASTALLVTIRDIWSEILLQIEFFEERAFPQKLTDNYRWVFCEYLHRHQSSFYSDCYYRSQVGDRELYKHMTQFRMSLLSDYAVDGPTLRSEEIAEIRDFLTMRMRGRSTAVSEFLRAEIALCDRLLSTSGFEKLIDDIYASRLEIFHREMAAAQSHPSGGCLFSPIEAELAQCFDGIRYLSIINSRCFDRCMNDLRGEDTRLHFVDNSGLYQTPITDFECLVNTAEAFAKKNKSDLLWRQADTALLKTLDLLIAVIENRCRDKHENEGFNALTERLDTLRRGIAKL
ncbi:hypothetical protein IJ847_00085 [Candidatus Saccharibacteria bacterium]|nr:hypothetical protein [Candidatus Saccharibacteria bacterium]